MTVARMNCLSTKSSALSFRARTRRSASHFLACGFGLLRSEGFGASFKVKEQRGQRYSEGRRNFGDIQETQIALAALDGAHEGPVDPAFVGEGLLGIALPASQFAYALAQGAQ